MGNIFNKDFQDFIKALNECNVEYILVGGYAVILHGYSRTTGDMDIWVNRNENNYDKLGLAFAKFGMPTFDMKISCITLLGMFLDLVETLLQLTL